MMAEIYFTVYVNFYILSIVIKILREKSKPKLKYFYLWLS